MEKEEFIIACTLNAVSAGMDPLMASYQAIAAWQLIQTAMKEDKTPNLASVSNLKSE